MAAAPSTPSGREAPSSGHARDLVSCIIIFYDAARYLDEAVQSILAQRYPHWELVLVDDGSVDGSTTQARRWAAEQPARIRYVEHPGHTNAGMSASRNLGLTQARGEFVAFLDADDVWMPHKLEEQVAIMRAHPEVGMVCGATQLWFSWSPAESGAAEDRLMEVGALPNRPHDPSPYRDVLVPAPALALALYPLGRGFSPSTSGFLLRRTAIDRVGAYEAAFRAMYEDQAFQIKIYLHVPVYVATAVWDRYRQHAASCSASARREDRVWRDRGRFLEWLGDYLERTRVVDPAVRRAFADAVWPFRHPAFFRIRQAAERLLPAAWFARLTASPRHPPLARPGGAEPPPRGRSLT